jgi:hypothetical protein
MLGPAYHLSKFALKLERFELFRQEFSLLTATIVSSFRFLGTIN